MRRRLSIRAAHDDEPAAAVFRATLLNALLARQVGGVGQQPVG